MTTVQRVFKVERQAVFSRWAEQANNSSGFNEPGIGDGFQSYELLGGNTLEIPVYWSRLSLLRGRFDFNQRGTPYWPAALLRCQA